MSDNYAVINGKRVELTDEQVKALGIKRKNPFERVNEDEKYYFIESSGDVSSFLYAKDCTDRMLFDAVNYFNDEAFANQVALHQSLYRKLLKFAYDNECEDTAEWDGENKHWRIIYNEVNDEFVALYKLASKEFTVYFSTKEGAERAAEEVVRPFMKEHPDFVW